MPNNSGMMHLKIMKGIAKTPQDSTSAEQGLDEINLLDTKGFDCDEYQIKIPAMKSSAVYADSPLTDGRTLISGALGNVTETIRVNLNASTIVQMAAMLSKLGRMKRDCNDFWDTFGQIDPVFIKHQVAGEPGPRYALLYDIDIDVETPIDPSTPSRTVTIVIEREYGWRGIAPGDNPKKWTYYVQNRPYTAAGAAITSGIDHLANATIYNRREWNTNQTALATQNYFDVAAANVPGDLDALCLLSCSVAVAVNAQLYFSRVSKPDLAVSGVNRKPAYILNAGDDSLLGADTTLAADTGAPNSSSTATAKRSETSFAGTTTDAMRVAWTGASRGLFDPSSLRGRFLAFARARLSASSTVTMHLRLATNINTIVDYPTATLTGVGSGGTGNTTAWETVYLGVVTFPYNDERIIVGDDGLGTDVSVSNDFILNLFAARTGSAVTLYVSDLILVPMDECLGLIKTISSTNTSFVIDNTGYYLHGKPGETAHAGAIVEPMEIKGSLLTLKAGADNRILMFGLTTSNQSQITPVYTVRLDIVPRWSGYRDA